MDSNRAAVQLTNTDAVVSKCCCVRAGYYEDEFIELLASANFHQQRRLPIINYGYYVRVAAIRRIVDEFVSSFGAMAKKCQMVSVGSGSDSLGFYALKNHSNLRVFEIDFPNIVSSKIRTIQRAHEPIFRNACDVMADLHVHEQKSQYVTAQYGRLSLIGCDLRENHSTIHGLLLESGFDPGHPTLFLSECVLVYLGHTDSEGLIKFLRSIMHAPVVMALYEPVNGEDKFGKVMIQHMKDKGCDFKSILPTPQEHERRLNRCGFEISKAVLMDTFTGLIKKKRVELIDELEEFNLLQQHYVIAVGVAILISEGTEPNDSKQTSGQSGSINSTVKQFFTQIFDRNDNLD